MKKTIIVVEGTHDEHHLKTLYPGIKTISVGGSAVDQHVLEFLVNYQNVLDIILLFEQFFLVSFDLLKSFVQIFF